MWIFYNNNNWIIYAVVTLSIRNFAFEGLSFFYCLFHGHLHIYTVGLLTFVLFYTSSIALLLIFSKLVTHLFKVHQLVNINALLLLLFLWFIPGSLFSNYIDYSRSKQCCLFPKLTYIEDWNIYCGREYLILFFFCFGIAYAA